MALKIKNEFKKKNRYRYVKVQQKRGMCTGTCK